MNVNAEPPPSEKLALSPWQPLNLDASPRFRFRLADLLTATLLFGGQLTYVMQVVLADEKSSRVGSVVFIGVLSAMAAFGALWLAVKMPTFERMWWPGRIALMLMLDVTLFGMLPAVLPALIIYAVMLLGAFVVMLPFALPIVLLSKLRSPRLSKVETGR